MQNQRQQDGNFMDPKTIVAIVLVGFVWIGWQNHLQEKYPDAYKKPVQTANLKASEEGQGVENQDSTERPKQEATVAATKTKSAPQEPVAEKSEVFTEYSDAYWSLKFSSKGMGLKEILIKDVTDRQGNPVPIGADRGYLPFETNLLGRNRALDFEIRQTSSDVFVGTALANGVEIQKTVRVESPKHLLHTEVIVRGVSDQFSGVVNYLSEPLKELEGSFLMPTFNNQEVVVAHGQTSDREYLDANTAYRGAFGQVQFFSLGGQYFGSAIVDRSDILPDLKVVVDPTTKTVFSSLSHPTLNRQDEFKVNYLGYAGPKDLKILQSIDPRLTELVDFGWFGWLAVVLFDIMQWFYGLFGNYGVAIILLTLLVRAVVLPFNLMSYKSMKSMQVVQPQIKALREKYKEDQQTLNREMMALMKDNKVNPLGGCLPMLLQFPVFIALYRVFGASIDLYKAPFALWIQDLSLKDPYFVLPVLMAGAFFLQTKLTPSTMDPTQQKVMMFMPVLFAVFMAGLPSALTLYMFVSTLFGILQQLYFMRDKKVSVPVTSKA